MSSDSESQDAVKEPPPTEATRAYKNAARQMHKDMGIAYSGNADADFAALMAAHQAGTVALARIELEYGKSAKVKRIAKKIIAANESEIEALNAWREKHP